jgi:hypothetical protein
LLGYREVTLGPGGVVSGVIASFGVDNRADNDWGDLPSSYITRGSDSALGGPSHTIIPGFQLGARNDGEVNGVPTPGADGDDLIGQDDDGIRILTNNGSLRLGTNTLEVTVNGVGGYLNAWMDIDGDGTFGPGEQVLTDIDLNPGTRQVIVTLPPNTASGPMAARFRWGEGGLSFEGPAGIGEVEDYYLANSVVQQVVLPGDYNLDGAVNDADYGIWRATYSTNDLRGDGNGDGFVDSADYIVWKNNVGATSANGNSSFSQPAAPRSLAPNVLSYQFADSPALQSWLQESGLLAHLQRSGNLRAPINHHVSSSQVGVSGFVVASGAGTPAAGAASTNGSSPFLMDVLAGLPVAGSTASTASTSSVEASQTNVGSDHAEISLLLLDEAWAAIDNDAQRDADDEPWTNTGDEDEAACDMALAAVLDDETAWWNTL